MSSSSTKKANKSGSNALEAITAQLFEETGPIRQQVIERILGAFSGQAPSETDAVTQQKQSAIIAGGERQKGQLRKELARSGLEDSSVGLAGIEDINRAIAQLLVSADTAELERLTQLGESLAFGQPVNQAVQAASTLAGVQERERASTAQATAGAGTSIGRALALLYGNLNSSSTTGGTVPAITSPNTGALLLG